MFQISRGALGALLVSSALSLTTAEAKTFNFNQTGRDTPVVVPDDWSVAKIRAGVEVKSGDGEVYLWLQAMDDANVKKLVDEYFVYYRQQGVTFTGRTSETNDSLAGVPVKIMDTPATYGGKPTIVRFIFSEPKAGARKGLLLGYWASPKGDKTHEAAVERLIADVLRP